MTNLKVTEDHKDRWVRIKGAELKNPSVCVLRDTNRMRALLLLHLPEVQKLLKFPFL